MIAAILSLFGSSAFGSLIGGVFAWMNRKTDLEAKRMDLEQEAKRWAHELAVKDKDLDYARLEAQGKKDVAVVEGDAAIEVARMAAIAAAQAADKVTADEIKAAGWWGFLFVWASAFNKLIRPVATVLLVGSALVINAMVFRYLTDGWATLAADKQFEIGMQALAWVTGQASMALSYWFVSRGSSK